MNITIDMMPEQYKPIIDLVGIEKTMILARLFSGQQLYIPMMEAFEAEAEKDTRDELMLQEFNGSNYRELAMKYRLSERRVRYIIQERKSASQTTDGTPLKETKFKSMIKAIGYEDTIKILQVLGGIGIYFQNYNNLIRHIKNQQLK